MLQETYLKAVVPINAAPYFLMRPSFLLSARLSISTLIWLIGNRAVVDIWDSVKVSHNRTTNPVTLSLLLRKCANVEHFATYRVKSSDSRLKCALKSFPIPEQLFLVFEWLLVVTTVRYWTILAPAGCQVIIRPNLMCHCQGLQERCEWALEQS